MGSRSENQGVLEVRPRWCEALDRLRATLEPSEGVIFSRPVAPVRTMVAETTRNS